MLERLAARRVTEERLGTPRLLHDIGRTSHHALDDLRATPQLLRARDEGAPTASPGRAPGLAGLPALAERLRAAGPDVRLDLHHGAETVPAPVGQACFRSGRRP